MPVDAIFKKEIETPAEIHNPQNLAGLSNIVKSIEKLQKEMDRPIWIENIDHVKGYLREELKTLSNAIQTIIAGIQFPKITGLQGLIDQLNNIYAFLQKIEYKPQINVAAPTIPEIKIPPIKVPRPQVDVQPPEVNVETPDIIVDLSSIIKALKPLQLITDRAGKPISVRLSDGDKFIKELSKIVGKQERWVTALATSKGMDEDEFKNKFTLLTQAYSIVSNRKTVAAAGTALRLVAASTKCFRVDLSADLANTNPVVIGNSAVVAANDSQKGIVLIPGNTPFTIFIDDVYKLYVDAQSNGDSVCFNYYTR